jgi:hypothetical protein
VRVELLDTAADVDSPDELARVLAPRTRDWVRRHGRSLPGQ